MFPAYTTNINTFQHRVYELESFTEISLCISNSPYLCVEYCLTKAGANYY